MRELTRFEIQDISGGFNCIDADVWQRVQDKAITDGVIISFLVSGAIGAVTAGLSQSIGTGIVAGAIIAPYIGIYGYAKSSAWDIFYK